MVEMEGGVTECVSKQETRLQISVEVKGWVVGEDRSTKVYEPLSHLILLF